MKNIMRFISVIALGAVVALASCSKDNRGAGPMSEGAFINSSFGNAEFALSVDNPQFVVPFMRTNKSGALTVQLEWSAENMAILPNPPASVSFSDGQDRVDVAVDVNMDPMVPLKPIAVSVVMKDNTYLYGLTAATVQLEKPVIYSGPVQVGYFTDGGLGTPFYGYALESFVKFQKGDDIEVYRLIDAYQPETIYEGFPIGSKDIMEEELTGDRYIVIDARDPKAVILKEQNVGIDWGYGIMKVKGSAPGTFVNNVATIKVAFDIGDGRTFAGTDIFDFNPQTPPTP